MVEFITREKPCRHDGTKIRYKSNGHCVDCVKRRKQPKLTDEQKQQRKIWYQEHKTERASEGRSRYVNDTSRYVYHIVKRAEQRAKTKNVPFDLSISDIVIPEICPILGVKFEIAAKGEPRDYSPSLDRIDPLRGYVKGNIQIISMKANRIKSNASIEEIEKVLGYLKLINTP